MVAALFPQRKTIALTLVKIMDLRSVLNTNIHLLNTHIQAIKSKAPERPGPMQTAEKVSESLAAIKRRLEAPLSSKTVVLTHHLQTEKSVAKNTRKTDWLTQRSRVSGSYIQ